MGLGAGDLVRRSDDGSSRSAGYYVGLLSAAELFGAAHQRPQVFQVVVDKYLPDRAFVGAPAAIINAVTDALGVADIAMPASPERVWRALQGV